MIKLLGIPFDANSSFLKGPALAPQRIRQADTDGSANRYSESCIEIKEGVNYIDAGDIQFTGDDPEQAENHRFATRQQLVEFVHGRPR